MSRLHDSDSALIDLNNCDVISYSHVPDKWCYLLVGPVMTKFTIALREIGTYKEVLRSQVISHPPERNRWSQYIKYTIIIF